MRTRRYPGDEQRSLVEPFILVYPRGRPRKIDLGEVLDAIFYSMLRIGYRWRNLPEGFPPRSAAWRYLDEWRSDAPLDRIHDALRREASAKALTVRALVRRGASEYPVDLAPETSP